MSSPISAIRLFTVAVSPSRSVAIFDIPVSNFAAASRDVFPKATAAVVAPARTAPVATIPAFNPENCLFASATDFATDGSRVPIIFTTAV